MRSHWLVLGSVLIFGCGDDGGGGGSTSTTDASSSSSSGGADESTGTNLCAECAPAVPPEWIGPVLTTVAITQVTVECPPEVPNEVDVVRDRLEPEAATCMCECGEPQGGCGPVSATYHDAMGCDGKAIGKPVEVTADMACVGGGSEAALAIELTNTEPTATCTATPTTNIPTVSFKDKLVACAPDSMACEDGGTCIPDVPHPMGVCIMKDGDETCPAAYPTKHTWYRQIDDTRGCSMCTCGNDFACTGTVDLFATDDCAPDAIGPLNLDACNPVTFNKGDTPGLALTAELTGTCTPNGGESMGDAVPEDPVTVCCTAGA